MSEPFLLSGASDESPNQKETVIFNNYLFFSHRWTDRKTHNKKHIQTDQQTKYVRSFSKHTQIHGVTNILRDDMN